MSFVLYNMTKGTKSVDAEVGDTVKVISTRQGGAKTYRNVYTIHIGQFDKAYGYDDGNITLTLAPELKTSGSIAVNPSALSGACSALFRPVSTACTCLCREVCQRCDAHSAAA